MSRFRTVHRLWRGIAAAPYLPIAAYLAVAGWVALPTRGGFSPAHLLAHALPSWLVVMWTVAVAAGGTMAVIGGAGRLSRLESSGLALLLYGAVTYGSIGGWAAAFPLGVVLVSAAVAAMCGLRMRLLSLSRRAQEVAAAIDQQSGE